MNRTKEIIVVEAKPFHWKKHIDLEFTEYRVNVPTGSLFVRRTVDGELFCGYELQSGSDCSPCMTVAQGKETVAALYLHRIEKEINGILKERITITWRKPR